MADRPDDDGDGIADARTEHVDEAAEADIADRIGDLEPEDEGREVGLGPAHLALQRRLEHPDHLPVDDMDGGCEEVQRTEEHTAELQSLVRSSYPVFCLK